MDVNEIKENADRYYKIATFLQDDMNEIKHKSALVDNCYEFLCQIKLFLVKLKEV